MSRNLWSLLASFLHMYLIARPRCPSRRRLFYDSFYALMTMVRAIPKLCQVSGSKDYLIKFDGPAENYRKRRFTSQKILNLALQMANRSHEYYARIVDPVENGMLALLDHRHHSPGDTTDDADVNVQTVQLLDPVWYFWGL